MIELIQIVSARLEEYMRAGGIVMAPLAAV